MKTRCFQIMIACVLSLASIHAYAVDLQPAAPSSPYRSTQLITSASQNSGSAPSGVTGSSYTAPVINPLGTGYGSSETSSNPTVPADNDSTDPNLIEMTGLLKSAYPQLSSAEYTYIYANRLYYRATLLDNEGNVAARLVSSTVRLYYYNGKNVKVSGYKIPISDNDSTTPPLLNVVKLEEILPPPPPQVWVELKGYVKYAYPQLSTAEYQYAYQNSLYYNRATLHDNDGKLIARLISKEIRLYSFHGKYVALGGYKLGISPDNSIPLVNVIKMEEIVIPPPPPVWVEMRGIMNPQYPRLSTPEYQYVYTNRLYYRATLNDNDGVITARLVSTDIPFYRYKGFYVEVAGYLIKPKTTPFDTGTTEPTPLINVEKLKVIYEPMPVETWRGVIHPNITTTTSAYWPATPFVLKDFSGYTIGFLNPSSNEMAELLKKHVHDFIVAVTGPVKKTEYYNYKIMLVQKLEVIQDLRHIVWMNDEPVVIPAGKEIHFNRLGDVILPIKNENEDGTVEFYPVLYQKNWDFDAMVPPLPPVEPDNSGAVMPPVVPVKYVEYNYNYDSRIKYMDGEKLMDDPVFTFEKPGFYEITITVSYIDQYGYIKKTETAQRGIRVVEIVVEDPDNDGGAVTP
ncbi:MAG: hypothetical protein C4541_01755 [Candidatus Auribacter fodinae]|uniref:PKD domain-containing protein n=1 Tax=Candidatus Auribacter fodinae TaxID=2093366 RepID=A0A3A4R5G6_9BACT|nr:MAG: hypothetical protein C4541_01755 [Candidatus Auribacter fodinae]